MPTVYDELPYPGAPFSQTHPDRLATLAVLFGLTPAPVAQCRVLELGCGDGGNLIPMAFALPEGRFHGIDLAGSAIARGQDLISQLQLANIRLQHLDLTQVNSDFGEFDYIIAHGLYSWVPPQVRDKILDICRSHLAPNGIAFISYNTYPGGHLRDAIREMMLFHTRHAAGARDRLRQGRDLLELLVQAHAEDDAGAVALRSQLQSLLARKPEHFFHDELGEDNHRFYFHDFLGQASRHGLQYLCEARLASMQTAGYAPEIAGKIRAFSRDDDLVQEQYLDFLKSRNFRQSVVCRAEIKIDRKISPERVTRMSIGSELRPSASGPDVHSNSAEEFKGPTNKKMTTNHPLAKAAMLHLSRVWPRAVAFPELLQIARALSARDTPSAGAPLEEDSSWLADMILKLYTADFLELHVHAPVFAAQAGERPSASAMARAQVRHSSTITNLRHASVEVEDELGRLLLLLLDGTRNRDQLLAELRARANSGAIGADQLEANLNKLARLALLVA